ncbi:hypothetical protein E4H12_10910 [Candidatus Thorarchaeota archaeon]|nr:MAG: hypothetical protein E4H12_10910 [Candidatus Thorarchaeota archaeon]
MSGNTDFNDTAQAEGWVGNGTESNPYIIEKLFIEASYQSIGIYSTTAYFIIRNCTFVKTGIESGIGLDLQSVQNGIIENCTFTNLWMACITWTVSNCTWNDNTFGDLLEGIWLQDASNCSITDNTFQSGGISLSGYSVSNWVHQIVGNTIREKALGYFEGQSLVDIDATDYGQIILANCSEVTVYNGDFSDVGISISIGHSNFSTAHGCHINGGRTGIFLERTYETLIETCSIIGSAEFGLYINETILTTVSNCSIRNIGDVGAVIGMGSNVTLLETTIKGCGYSGIAIYESPYFYLLDSILEDNNSGLEIGGCAESEISGNTFQLNDQYGISIVWDCEGSRIFGNEFVFNYVENANDDGSGTLWDDGMSIGNLWDDYSGSGYYYVPGSRGGIDHYPGIVDIAHGIDILGFLTDDITYTHGTIGHSIVWYTNCTHPSMYSIFKDGVLMGQHAWDGDWITYNVDGLSVGVYNFTLEILDTFAETASDTVIVTVNPQTTATIDTTPTTPDTTTSNSTGVGGIQEFTLVISIGSTLVIVIVIVLMLRTKRGPM